MKYFLPLLCALVVVTGCSGPEKVPTGPPVPAGFPNHSVETIIGNVASSVAPFWSMDSRASLSVTSPNLTENVSAVIRFDRSTALYASIRATILNAEVGRSLVTADSFYLYNRVEREFIYGPVNLANRYLPISGSLDEIHAMLTGSMVPDANLSWQVSYSGNAYSLYNEASETLFEIDPTVWKVTRMAQDDRFGRQIDERLFSDFVEVDGNWIPQRLVLRQPLEGRVVSMFQRGITPNPGDQDFDLKVDRSRLKQILIDQ